MDFKKTFISFALLGLVIFGIMSFAILFQKDNDSPERLTDNEIINNTYNSLYGNYTGMENTAKEQDTVFGNVTPTQSYGEVEITSVVAPTKAFKSMILGTYNILIKLPSEILGISPVVTAILSAILIMLIIVGIWAIYKGAINP
jgi:hypothetical protein